MIINGREYTFIGSTVSINQPSPDLVQLFFMVNGGSEPNKLISLGFEEAKTFWANWTTDEQAYEKLQAELNA